MQDRPQRVLATSFITDTASEGTIFPSAGGNSADSRVQAVYWRCIVVFFNSARINNPGLTLRFFTNTEPPELDGRTVRSILEGLGVEIRIVALTHRLVEGGEKSSWGNVLYFLDVLDSQLDEPDGQLFVLADCDVVVARSVAPLFEMLGQSDFVGYVVGLPANDDINGMTRTSLTRAAVELFDRSFPEPVLDYGGELLGTRIGAWKQQRHLFHRLLEDAGAGKGAAADVRTEEHMFSIVFAGLGEAAKADTSVLKRMWTSRQFNTVQPGDERFAMWHLPAEKRYGLKYLYKYLKRHDFRPDLDPGEFRQVAMKECGIPSKRIGKVLRDSLVRVQMMVG